jgi:hypothetical protein
MQDLNVSLIQTELFWENNQPVHVPAVELLKEIEKRK